MSAKLRSVGKEDVALHLAVSLALFTVQRFAYAAPEIVRVVIIGAVVTDSVDVKDMQRMFPALQNIGEGRPGLIRRRSGRGAVLTLQRIPRAQQEQQQGGAKIR